MSARESFPIWRQVVLDATDPRGLAEFYRLLLGFAYRPGDEPPEPGLDDERGRDWLVIHPASGGFPRIAFQQADAVPETTWPEPGIPQQLHLDLSVTSKVELDHQHERAIGLGARLRFDRSEDPDEPLRVYADPSGHLFCIFLAPAAM
jgi:Glyoxalase-like domain